MAFAKIGTKRVMETTAAFAHAQMFDVPDGGSQALLIPAIDVQLDDWLLGEIVTGVKRVSDVFGEPGVQITLGVAEAANVSAASLYFQVDFEIPVIRETNPPREFTGIPGYETTTHLKRIN